MTALQTCLKASDTSPRPSDSQPIETARRLHVEALDAQADGRPADAAPLALRAIEILEREDAPQIYVANALHALAHIQKDLGHLASAEISIDRALGILERLRDLGEDPLRTRLEARSLGLLANLKRSQGHHPEAEQLFRRALALTEDLQMASLLNGLAPGDGPLRLRF